MTKQVYYKRVGREITDEDEWENYKFGAMIFIISASIFSNLFSFIGRTNGDWEWIGVSITSFWLIGGLGLLFLIIGYCTNSKVKYIKLSNN